MTYLDRWQESLLVSHPHSQPTVDEAPPSRNVLVWAGDVGAGQPLPPSARRVSIGQTTLKPFQLVHETFSSVILFFGNQSAVQHRQHTDSAALKKNNISQLVHSITVTTFLFQASSSSSSSLHLHLSLSFYILTDLHPIQITSQKFHIFHSETINR